MYRAVLTVLLLLFSGGLAHAVRLPIAAPDRPVGIVCRVHGDRRIDSASERSA